MRLPIGISDFKTIVTGDYQFVDKSLFIKDIMNDGASIILITRPRRFGKTLNMSMLNYFLQQNELQQENLFANLAIAEDQAFCQKHQHHYPVIFLTFKDVKQSNFDNAYANIATIMSQLYGDHRYLLHGDLLYGDEKEVFNALLYKKADQLDLELALKKLSIYLTRKFKKEPIVLIDEYDTPVQEGYLNNYYDDMVKLMRGILGQSLKDNPYISKAVLTGITRVSQESFFSGLNNIEVYSLLREDYGQYFGFTEKEVETLIDQTQQDTPLADIKEWYNGYQIGRHILYNPWSIISCLKNNGKIGPYWVNTSSNELLKLLLTKADSIIKQQFDDLLQGHSIEQPLSDNLVFSDIEKKEGALWILLLYAGYLKIVSSELCEGRLMARLAIPNKEVRFVYDDIVRGWFSEAISFKSYDTFIRSLIQGDMETFKKYISAYIMQSGSYFDFNKDTPEQVFHAFMLGIVMGLRNHYVIQSNQEAGFGRADLLCIPKDNTQNGIALEFKAADSPEMMQSKAKEALMQIKDKNYVEAFNKHDIKSVLTIGLAFCGKQMDLVYEMVDM